MSVSKSFWFGFLVIIFLAFSPYHAIQRANLKADDASYLAHGFTLGLDFNFQYRDNVADWKTRDETIASHPTGPGIMAAPFIAAFSLIDRINHHPVIENHHQYQNSWSYFGFVFASVFYFLSALFFYAKGLKSLNLNFSSKHFLFISSSFGILYYVLFRPVMGHSFEFFSLSLCFWGACQSIRENKISHLCLLITALGCVLTLQIRPAAFNVFLLPLILYVFYMHKQISRNLITLLVWVILCYLPFALINLKLYGAIFPSFEALYGSGHGPIPPMHSLQDVLQVILTLIKRSPQIFIILFSSEFGVFFNSSILFFGIIFFLFYSLKYRKFLTTLFILAYVGLPMAITLFWQSVGDGYGYRFFFCYFPLAILGYALWWQRCLGQYQQFSLFPLPLKSLSILIFSLCAFGLYANIVFSVNDDLVYKSEKANAFGHEGGGAVGYNFAAAKSAFHPATWVTLVTTRSPGFFAAAAPIDYSKLPLPQNLVAKFQKYETPQGRVYLQALLVLMVIVVGYYWMSKKKCEAHNKPRMIILFNPI